MSGFASLMYGTLKGEGIDTEGMSFDEAYKKFQEIGGTSKWEGEKKPTEKKEDKKDQPAEKKEEGKKPESKEEKKGYKLSESDETIVGDAIYYALKENKNATADDVIKQINIDNDGFIGTEEKETAIREYLNKLGYENKKDVEEANRRMGGQNEERSLAKFDEYGIPDEETLKKRDRWLKGRNLDQEKLSKMSNLEFNSTAQKLMEDFGIEKFDLAKELLVDEGEKYAPDETFTRVLDKNGYAYTKDEKTIKYYQDKDNYLVHNTGKLGYHQIFELPKGMKTDDLKGVKDEEKGTAIAVFENLANSQTSKENATKLFEKYKKELGEESGATQALKIYLGKINKQK